MTTDRIKTTRTNGGNNKHKKYEGRGFSGIANRGNTCYMNACMCVLSHTYELNDLMDNEHLAARRSALTERKPNAILLDEWDALRKILWNQNCTVSPGGFLSAIQRVARETNNAEFQGLDQNDASEFLLFLFDAFHNAYARAVVMRIDGIELTRTDTCARQCYQMLKDRYASDYSECLDLFYGIQMSMISDIATSGVGATEAASILSAKPEPYSVLNLCIPHPIQCAGAAGAVPLSLYDCFDAYCERERMDGDNAWFNSATGQKQAVDKFIRFWSMPEIMVIELKRFVPTTQYGRFKKNVAPITIPLENASFAKYVRGYAPESYVYDLYGACNHHGSIGGGHYTATVRVADGRWFNFNDERVTETTNLAQLESGSAPYCLFYRRRSSHAPAHTVINK
jgi:ubiquitin carboxyl-terminal hydrolase 8